MINILCLVGAVNFKYLFYLYVSEDCCCSTTNQQPPYIFLSLKLCNGLLFTQYYGTKKVCIVLDYRILNSLFRKIWKAELLSFFLSWLYSIVFSLVLKIYDEKFNNVNSSAI